MNQTSTAASRLFFTVPAGRSIREVVPLKEAAVPGSPAMAPAALRVTSRYVPRSLPRLASLALPAVVPSSSPRRQ